MIYKTDEEILRLRDAALITRKVLDAVSQNIKPGVTTKQLDNIAWSVLKENGAESNFAKVEGYYKSCATCISVNEEVVHGVPRGRVIKKGDLVKIDAGALYNGYNGDSCVAVIAGYKDINEADSDIVKKRFLLSNLTKEAMWAGIAALASAKYIYEVGEAIERYIKQNSNFSILKEYTGHGIGKNMHENPTVFNFKFVSKTHKNKIKPGLVVCIEPIISDGSNITHILDDGWTVVLSDGSNGCQWENQVAVTKNGIWVLSEEDGGKAGLEKYGLLPSPL